MRKQFSHLLRPGHHHASSVCNEPASASVVDVVPITTAEVPLAVNPTTAATIQTDHLNGTINNR